jgi:hypothetical protein
VRFDYQGFPVQGVGGQRHEMIYRPMVRIRISGPKAGEDVSGLLDTGADDVLIPRVFMDLLGVEAIPGGRATIGTAGRGTAAVEFGTVDLELRASGRAHRWPARVGFHDGWAVLLGHKGFMEHFTATFNGRQRRVTLQPNGTFPTAAAGRAGQ